MAVALISNGGNGGIQTSQSSLKAVYNLFTPQTEGELFETKTAK